MPACDPSMFRSTPRRTPRAPGWPALLLALVASAAGSVWAQPSAPAQRASAPHASPGMGAGTGAPGHATTAPARRSTAAGQVAEEDREWMEDLAHAHLAEIDTGRMALDKTQNAQVRQFAQHMVDEHSAGLAELQKLAQAKGVKLPTETDFQHKAIAAALKVMTGDTFDRQYIRQVGVNDHRRTLEMLQRMQQDATDPEVKALAAKGVPMVQRHLGMARQMAAQR